MLTRTAEVCRSDGLLGCSWSYEQATGHSSALEPQETDLLVVPLFVFLNLSPFGAVVEDDEDDFPNTRPDGEFLHNNNGSKEKRKSCHVCHG